jgi:hypothetical protein
MYTVLARQYANIPIILIPKVNLTFFHYFGVQEHRKESLFFPTSIAIDPAKEDNTTMSQLAPEVIELLSSSDSFFIQQRIRMIEAVTGGCLEQPNVYDVFRKEDNKRVMVSRKTPFLYPSLPSFLGNAIDASHQPPGLGSSRILSLFRIRFFRLWMCFDLMTPADHQRGVRHNVTLLLRARSLRLRQVLSRRQGRPRAQAGSDGRLVLRT